MCHTGQLSCHAKLVRVVLENQGPLSPGEVAMEGHLSTGEARSALEEMRELGLVETVCGLRESREEVYELTEAGREQGRATV
jgi:DNA-binding MarR family transcriptional regulator